MARHAAVQVSPWDVLIAYVAAFVAWAGALWDLSTARHRDSTARRGRPASGADDTFVIELRDLGVPWPLIDQDLTPGVEEAWAGTTRGLRQEVRA